MTRRRASGTPALPERAPVPVEILHTSGCGRWEAARAAVHRVAAEAGVAITISERLVGSMEAARELRFLGSPTVRVRGRDVQPEVEEHEDFSLG